MSEPSAEGFVTVAEAARALQLSERQARRRAAVLEATGRTRTDGRTRLVTVADMRTVRPDADKKSLPASMDASAGTPGHDRMTDRTDIQSEADGRTDGHVEALAEMRAELETERRRASESEKRAAVAEARADLLESERDRLDKKLDEALAIARAAQDEARAARLLGSGRATMQIESSERSFEAPSGLATAPQNDDRYSEGAKTPLDTVKAPSEATKLQPWWAFWKARGGS